MTLNLSPAQFLASLPPKQRQKKLDELGVEQKARLNWHWPFWARPNQLPPDGDWLVWLFLAGRGAGKTRSGAEWVRHKIKHGCSRIALVAPTAGDARDIVVEGESGLLAVCWEGDKDNSGNLIGKPLYEPSKRRVTWENGALATLYSAEEPERLRGPQHDAAWCDELAAWKRLRETWDMLQFGLRLGTRPQCMISTTPKPLALLRELLKDEKTVVSTGSTFDNAANLAPAFLSQVKAKYEGTRLGRQELYAELLDEAEGALWTRAMIEDARHSGQLPVMKRIVVAVDPAITAKEESDETGIVACGVGLDGYGYLLEDVSGRFSPDGWAKAAVNLYNKWEADRIIAEGNQGGDMVAYTIATIRKTLPVKIVHASRGKAARAEPVAALYEQNKMRHAGGFPDLEDQLVTWEPLSGLPSPDRLDALVWGFTELLVGPQPLAQTRKLPI